jgi:hypothetical protein
MARLECKCGKSYVLKGPYNKHVNSCSSAQPSKPPLPPLSDPSSARLAAIQQDEAVLLAEFMRGDGGDIAFKPSCFGAFETFKCFRQLRLLLRPRDGAVKDTSPTSKPITAADRGDAFEARVFAALRASASNREAGIAFINFDDAGEYTDLVQRVRGTTDAAAAVEHVMAHARASFAADPQLGCIYVAQLALNQHVNVSTTGPEWGWWTAALGNNSRVHLAVMKPDLIVIERLSDEDAMEFQLKSLSVGGQGDAAPAEEPKMPLKVSVIDVKSSSNGLKTSHKLQVAFYCRVLSALLYRDAALFFHDEGAVWLDPAVLPAMVPRDANAYGAVPSVFKLEPVNRVMDGFLATAFAQCVAAPPSIEDVPAQRFCPDSHCGLCDYRRVCGAVARSRDDSFALLGRPQHRSVVDGIVLPSDFAFGAPTSSPREHVEPLQVYARRAIEATAMVCAELADLTAFALHKRSAVELSHTNNRNRSGVGLLARLHPFALRAWNDDAAATGPSATTAVFLHSAVDPQECSGVFVRPDSVTPFDSVPDMCAKLLGLSTSGVRLYLLWCGSDVLRVRHLLINAAPSLPDAARVIRLLFPTDGFDEAVVAVTTFADSAEGAQHRVVAVKDAVTCAFALPTPARAVTARDVQLFVGRDDVDISANTVVSEHPVFLERDPMDPHAAFKLLFNTAHAVAKSYTEFDDPPAPPGFIQNYYTDDRWKPWALLAIETAKKVATIRSAYSTRGRGARGSIDDGLPPTFLQCVEAPRLEEGYVRAWYRMMPHLVEPHQVPATFTELPMTSWHPSAAMVKEADIASPKHQQQRPQDPRGESSAAAAVDPRTMEAVTTVQRLTSRKSEPASLGFLRGRYWIMPSCSPMSGSRRSDWSRRSRTRGRTRSPLQVRLTSSTGALQRTVRLQRSSWRR